MNLVQLQPDELLEREEVLATLRDMLDLCATRCGQLAVVEGEAGIGKSSLVRAIAASVESPAHVAWGQCDDLFTPRQLGPLYDMAAQLGDSFAAKLEAGGSQAGLFPALLAALDALPPGSMLVFEDVHWADHSTLDLLTFIARRLLPLRIMILMTYRSDEVSPAHPLTSLLGQLPPQITRRIALEPLSPDTVRRLVGKSGRDATELYRTTGGNPFFLSEILSQPDAGADRLPQSVRDAVLVRAGRVPAPARLLLDALAVSPEAIPDDVVAAVESAMGLSARQALEEEGLLVRDRDQRLRFRHELARLAILSALTEGDRREHHARLLEIYLSLDNESMLSLVVHHAAAVGNEAVILDYAARAAERAAALGACKEAAAQLELALRHADKASPEQTARLLESWAYQASLFEISDRVIEARKRAISLWRQLGRPERVGDNLRWLWRLYWYLGKADLAEAAATESLEILEAIPPSIELANAYALRALMSLLKGRRGEAIRWGSQALDLEASFNNPATRVQVMVTTATAKLFDGDEDGRALMEEALALAFEHDLHEEAARVYTNYSEYAIVVGDWSVAERLVREGLAFDVKHGLDAWTTYLRGRHAQLLLGRGRLAEARTLAEAALAADGATVLMRLPAMTVLATVKSLLDQDDALALLQEVLSHAVGMQEQQRITPARLSLIRHHYLRGDLEGAREQVEAMREFGVALLRPWDAGALQVWCQRLDVAPLAPAAAKPNRAQALELEGDYATAAEELDRREMPFEAAMVRLAGARAGHEKLAHPAARGFASIGCDVGERAAAALAPTGKSGARRRGPYRAARQHPLGLTRKEVEVLSLMAEGATNADIASQLSRSPRTVEHHVSSILGKLDASNRLEATLRVIAEPWIAQH